VGDGFGLYQSAYRKGFSTSDNVVLLRSIIATAKQRNQIVRIVSLDVKKAFDTVPKMKAAHLLASQYAGTMPLISRLLYKLATAPARATFGDVSFETASGVPQGGLLSPILFLAVMKELENLISFTGFTFPSGIKVPMLLFADDILLIDVNPSESNEKIELTSQFFRAMGCSLNHSKTQVLNIRPGSLKSAELRSTVTRVDGKEVTESSMLEYLGLELSSRSHNIASDPRAGNVISSFTTSALVLLRFKGLSTFQGIELIRVVPIAKTLYGIEATLKVQPSVLAQFMMSMKACFSLGRNEPHDFIKRELGSLYNPEWWAIKLIITYYFKQLRDRSSNQLLRSSLQKPEIFGVLKEPINKILEPTLVTADDLADSYYSLDILIHFAQTMYSALHNHQIVTAAKEKNIYHITPELFEEYRHGPAKYLKCVDGKFGIRFRRPYLGPAGMRNVPCFFCKGLLTNTSTHEYIGDIGIHVTFCPEAIRIIPPPRRLSALLSSERRAACLLLDSVDAFVMDDTLKWMKKLLEWRRPKAKKYFKKYFKPDSPDPPANDPSVVAVDDTRDLEFEEDDLAEFCAEEEIEVLESHQVIRRNSVCLSGRPSKWKYQ
jgi:Reverse transcriptase (RNA-dependent DNA polymerase)